jgi:hypothetical protein
MFPSWILQLFPVDILAIVVSGLIASVRRRVNNLRACFPASVYYGRSRIHTMDIFWVRRTNRLSTGGVYFRTSVRCPQQKARLCVESPIRAEGVIGVLTRRFSTEKVRAVTSRALLHGLDDYSV